MTDISLSACSGEVDTGSPTRTCANSKSPALELRLSAVRKWIVVAAGTLAMMAGFGVTTTVALLVKPFEVEFGWLRADIAFAYTLLSAGAALGGLVAGFANDRLDSRPITVFGTVAMGAGLVAIAWQSDLGAIQTIFLAIGVFGFACVYTPVLATVGLWFDKGRGLAMGIVTAGGALGQGVMPAIMQPIITAHGWRTAFIAVGLGFVLLIAPLMWFVAKPERVAEAPRGSAQNASWPMPPAIGIAWLSVAGLFCCASMAVPLVHLVALLTDRGLSDSLTASLVLVVMLSAAGGRVVFGMFADRHGVLAAYALAVLSQTLTVYWFVPLSSLTWLWGLAALFGFGFGGVMTTLLLCARAAAPARMSGLATSLVTLFAWVGMGVGGYQGGYCFDMTGTYATSFAGAALAGGLNLLVLAGLALHLRSYRTGTHHVRVSPVGVG
jgi:MFS family permease